METIHLKTVDPLSQELLRSAAKQGLELSWDRFEKLQPQDGFLRLGLTCPFGCLQGPCRIDPFERGPGKGVCGMTKDEMAAGMLLRLCLQGTMEAMAAVSPDSGMPERDCSPNLEKMISAVLSSNDQQELSIDDVFKSSVLLHRPSSSYRTLLQQALRLSLITLGFQEQGNGGSTADSRACTIGYGTVANQAVRIGLSGQPSGALAEALEKQGPKGGDTPGILVSLGDWILLENSFVPIACTTGESELLVSSGAIHLLVAGPATEPGLLQLCEKMAIPVVTDSEGVDAAAVWLRARTSLESRSQLDLFADAPAALENRVLMTGDNITQDDGLGNEGRIVIIGGSDTPQLSLGSLPTALASELFDKGFQIAGWGDAALWILKTASSSQGQSVPFVTLENSQGPLHVVKGLGHEGQLDRLAGICFTGMNSCLELTMAIGLAYLGCRVSTATPIPIQGSRAVIDGLSEMLQKNGGQLCHFDHPAQPGELSEWLANV